MKAYEIRIYRNSLLTGSIWANTEEKAKSLLAEMERGIAEGEGFCNFYPDPSDGKVCFYLDGGDTKFKIISYSHLGAKPFTYPSL